MTDGIRAQEWWLGGLGVPQAWQTDRGTGVTVAVLSTGVAANSADLSGNVTTGPDFSQSGRSAGGPYWGICGTAVASVIAGHGHGAGGNSGVIGIAPAAKILSVRVTLEYDDPLNASAAITRRLPGAIAAGIMYAVSHGAKVIELPLDPGTFGLTGDSVAAGGSQAEQSAVQYALAKNVVLVAPSGDDGAGARQVNHPAAYPGVLAVAATSQNGQVALFSGRRSYVTLSAPGVGLLTASMLPAGASGYVPGYSHISTTSVASAMVAGVAALITSKYPQLTPAQVTNVLRSSATGKVSIVNAAAAMKAASVLVARLKPAAPPAPAARAKPRPAPPAVRKAAAPHRAASTVASSVLRDAVFAIGALIAILLGVLFLTRARRKRGATPRSGRPAQSVPAVGSTASRARMRGQHEHQRPSRGRDEPEHEEVLIGLRQLAQPGSPAAAGWPAPSSWRTNSDWQGSSLGEVAHSSPLAQPALAPVPKSASRAPRGPASPPWAPAPEPDSAALPLPSLPGSSSFPFEAETGIRVPGDMSTPFGGPDLSEPFAGRDVLTRASFGLAAAPVPADYAAPPELPQAPDHAVPPELTHTDPGESTEVFPIVPGFDFDAQDGDGAD